MTKLTQCLLAASLFVLSLGWSLASTYQSLVAIPATANITTAQGVDVYVGEAKINSLSFGDIPPGGEATREIQVRNPSTTEKSLAVNFEGVNWANTSVKPTLEFRLRPDESINLTLSLKPFTTAPTGPQSFRVVVYDVLVGGDGGGE